MASEKITKFVEEIKTLTVLELNELVKACLLYTSSSWERKLVSSVPTKF